MTVVETVVEFLKPILADKLKNPKLKPIVIGVEGPQGSGKTTASARIRQELSKIYSSSNIVQFSMDDFYLTHQQQQIVNAANKDNKLLQGRGLPGTHDTEFLLKTLDDLVGLEQKDKTILIPVYDKSAYSGKGDRKPVADWIPVSKPIDLIIFEGWFNGYTSISENTKLTDKWRKIKKDQVINKNGKFNHITDQNLISVNDNLKNYEKIWDYFDYFICLKTPDIKNVYSWRLQQEHDLISSTATGMTDDEVEKFVDRYMPMYYLYYDRLDIIEKKVKTVELNIDSSRCLINSSYYLS